MIELAGALGRLPPRLEVIGIEGRDFIRNGAVAGRPRGRGTGSTG